MAKKLKAGDVIRGYRITKVFGPGMMAISYAARSPAGGPVFFKQYKSPAPTVVWYDLFVAYQRELSSRVRNGPASRFAVAQLDAFEEVWAAPAIFRLMSLLRTAMTCRRSSMGKQNSTGDPKQLQPKILSFGQDTLPGPR